MKRELQNTADLAALSGVQTLSNALWLSDSKEIADVDCSAAEEIGKQTARENFKSHGVLSDSQLEVTCGKWKENQVPGDPRHFIATPTVEDDTNSLYVKITYDALPFSSFSFGSTIVVEAIAKSSKPVAAFQVGSQLLRFDNEAPLGSLLGLVGLDVSTLTLLDSNGLAGATITPSGLLGLLGGVGINELGLLTPNGVAKLDNVTVLQLINASAELVGQGTAAAVELGVLAQKLVNIELEEIKLLDTAIPLGGGKDQPGLLAFLGIGGNDPLGGALDVKLGVGDLLKTAIAVAANGHALEIPDLNLLGLAKAKLRIVEPPVIAIGPVGITGYSAQVRLWLDIDTDNLLGGLLTPLVSGLLGTRVHLPIAVDVVSGEGELTKLQCSKNPPTMDVSVKSRILNVCVGGLTENDIFSTTMACHDISSFKNSNPELIRLLHIPVLSGKLYVPALEDDGMVSGLAVDETGKTDPNSLNLGDTVEGIVDGVLELLSGLFRAPNTNSFPKDWVWNGSYENDSLIPGMVLTYLEEAEKDALGRYDINKANELITKGRGSEGDEDYLPKLLEEDFVIPDSVVEWCGLSKCQRDGTFTEVFYNTTEKIDSLGDILGFGDSCRGIFKNLVGDYNQCVRNRLTALLTDNQQYIPSFEPKVVDTILTVNVEDSCRGLLCIVLDPIVSVLKPILNGVGSVLTAVLDNLLGLEVGRTEVTALAIDCDPAQLVY
ncbi:hypothetical protein GCM10011450_19360 [Advenella faeciporci]|uniref:DUF2134 domain-containing protein n=1 Tax=Advenella faeciporci TaxID=797535 RepID=A0A918JNF4_9BURK|nr:hypothetical protein GCM10011450_19360 [Advenella faeciporci]